MTEPVTVPITILDSSNPGMQRWPGSAVLLPDGKVLYYYERYVTIGSGLIAPAIFACEADTPLGPYAAEVRINKEAVERDGIDPTIILLDGVVYGGWFGYRIWVAPRLASGSWGDQDGIMTPPDGWRVIEPTFCRANSRTYMPYVKRPEDAVEGTSWDVCVRELLPGLTLTDEVVIAPGGQGARDRLGHQTVRPTLVGAGYTDGLIAAWTSEQDVGGERSIVTSISSDGGLHWSAPVVAFDYQGHDLINPFPLKLGNDDIRFYFAQDKRIARCGFIRTTDNGQTWTHYDLLTQGSGASYGHSWAFRYKDKAYIFVGVNQTQRLGVYEIDTSI